MDFGSLIMLALLMGVFYFILVRPQKKRLQEHSALLKAIEPGDEVVTVGGIYGFVNRVDKDEVWLEVAEGVEVRLTKQAVSRKVAPAEADEPAEQAGEPASEVEKMNEPDTSS
ncbi:MAG: preprotein translocase subunit YajC [Actinomycetota bacterium]